VASATDLTEKDGAGANGKDAANSTRPNPVALEVPVSVTWAKPARPNEKRELFTEETVTVLVFRDGAVIQLAAAIAVGQLLFLTHKKTKREVVCQVVHKRSFRPTSCFVELEFTEEAEHFWGVSFPTNEEGAKKPPAAEAVAAEEATEDDRSEPVAAPKTEEVAQLKDEVQTLRKQLQELKDQRAGEDKRATEEKKAAEEREAEASRLAEAEVAARRTAEGEAEAKQKTEQPGTSPVRPRIAMKLPSLGATLESPSAPVEAPRVSSGLNTGRAAEQKEDAELEELLPKPALDFSKAKPVDPDDPFGIYRPARRAPGKREKMLAAGLVALLLVGGAAWFMHRGSKSRSAEANEPEEVRLPPEDIGNGQVGANTAASPSGSSAAVSGNVRTNEPLSATATSPGAGSKPDSTNLTKGEEVVVPATAAKPEGKVAKKEVPAKKDGADGKSGTAWISKNRGKAETSAESKPQPVQNDTPVIPARLLHSVSPVYPPDAMRHYITGDVRIEAQVDAKGRVGGMNVIFGPAAFRQVAMDALRQYEYAPATQGGKPVASKVMVTVKFWFDP
jgi:TonB family protein